MPQQTGESNDSQATLDMQLCFIAWRSRGAHGFGRSAQAGPGQDAGIRWLGI